MSGPSMRAAVLYDVGRMEVRDVARHEPGPGQARLRVAAVGLCGTDFHIFGGHANYHTDGHGRRIPLAEHPLILGHEVVGRVEALGPGVAGFALGDRVVLDQGHNCASAGLATRCEYCESGDSHQCEHYQEHGITGLQGGLAESLIVPAVNLVRIETDVASVEAVLTEPLACIAHAMAVGLRARGRYALGAGVGERRARSLLITGAGPAGLLFLQYVRQVIGFDGHVLVSEPDAFKREQAAAMGAETIDPAPGLVEAVLDRTDGRRADWVIEASGSARVFADLAGVIRKQATVILYGHGHAGLDISMISNLQFKEPTLLSPIGASGPLDDRGQPVVYRQALRLIEEGRIRVSSFLTHRYQSLDAVPAAFAGDHRHSGYIKGVVDLSD